MASMERFETLLGKADEAAEMAVGLVASTQGSERGKLYASLATMWQTTAMLEHQIFVAEEITRRVDGWGRRIYALEARLQIAFEREYPDVFAEPAEAETTTGGI